MIWEVKEWAELSTNEVENIFSLRLEVFVVEQDCVYQDIDGKDQKAKHVLGKKDNEIVAYARIFKPGEYFKEASFGRAVVKKTERGKGIGDELVINAIKNISDYTPGKALNMGVKECEFENILILSAHCVINSLTSEEKIQSLLSKYGCIFGK